VTSRVGGTSAVTALAVLAFFLARAPADGLDLTYQVTTGGTRITYEETIRASAGGFRAVVKSPLEESGIEMGSGLETLAWHFRVPGEGTDITARRAGAALVIGGRFKGQSFDRTFDVGTFPWYEYQELSLDRFAAAAADRIEFVTIDRTTMKLVRMRAQKKGTVEMSNQGRAVRAVEAELLIDGIPAFLLRSRFWLRESDGRYVKLSVPPMAGLGDPTLVELTGESGSVTE
jgi:hypothetical protein